MLASIDSLLVRAVVLGFVGRASPEGEGLTRRHLKTFQSWLLPEYDYNPTQINTLESFITTFGSFGPGACAAIPTLTSLLNHKDRSIRQAARDALGRIEMTRLP